MTMSIATIILFSIAGLCYIFYPLISKKQGISPSWGKFEDKLAELEDHKLGIFATLRDMEADYATNKISKEDFEHAWLTYKNNAINVLKQIDLLKSEK
ncbi:hypothetical protein HY745_00065 [Candidatus Desantisbacteria bacterium]|nr:hypothetical protein [Candidatus Desantisbacteria bacterium]